jgi:hypothetical protein
MVCSILSYYPYNTDVLSFQLLLLEYMIVWNTNSVSITRIHFVVHAPSSSDGKHICYAQRRRLVLVASYKVLHVYMTTLDSFKHTWNCHGWGILKLSIVHSVKVSNIRYCEKCVTSNL